MVSRIVRISLVLCVARIAFGVPCHASDACESKSEDHPQTLHRPCWDKASSQNEMNVCAKQDWQSADGQLNRVYHQVLAKFAKDSKRLGAIQRSERAWRAFRDAELDAMYPPGTRDNEHFGSIFPVCWGRVNVRYIEQRIKELQAYLAEENSCSPWIREP